MGSAFHAAGVHQHLRALDAPARGFVRQPAQPAVARAFGGAGPSLSAQLRVQRIADVVDKNIRVVLEQPCGGKQGVRRLFSAQMPHHHRPQMLLRLHDGLPPSCRLKNNPRLGAHRRWQGLGGAFLQHHQMLCIGK